MTTQSGHTANVTVANRDQLVDLAAVTRSDRLPPALPLGVDPVPGDLVRALGYPGGGAFTATDGWLIEYRDGSQYGRPGMVLATSVEVEPGNSGGPLVDADGKVVGVVFAIDLTDGDGLAIPVSLLTGSQRGTWSKESAAC